MLLRSGVYAALSNVPNIHGEIGVPNPQRYSCCFVIDQFDSFTAFTAVAKQNLDTLHKLSGCVCVFFFQFHSKWCVFFCTWKIDDFPIHNSQTLSHIRGHSTTRILPILIFRSNRLFPLLMSNCYFQIYTNFDKISIFSNISHLVVLCWLVSADIANATCTEMNMWNWNF